jgi:hypothetical protein
MDLEGFLESLRQQHHPRWGPCPFPDVVTEENVNRKYGFEYEFKTLLELAVYRFANAKEKIIPSLLNIGAKIPVQCFLYVRVMKYFLELGIDPNHITTPDGYSCLDTLALYSDPISTVKAQYLMDYGARPNREWNLRTNHGYFLYEYFQLVNRRASSCRQALLALIRTCKRSKFPALRGIVLCFAKQVWAMRGGEGCGARGHLWAKI